MGIVFFTTPIEFVKSQSVSQPGCVIENKLHYHTATGQPTQLSRTDDWLYEMKSSTKGKKEKKTTAPRTS